METISGKNDNPPPQPEGFSMIAIAIFFAYVIVVFSVSYLALKEIGVVIAISSIFFWVIVLSSQNRWSTLIRMSLVYLVLFGHLLLPSMVTPRHVSWRYESRRKLATIGEAILSYEKAHGRYPPPYLKDQDGNPTLSWRVLILPYLKDEIDIPSGFNYREPWDSEHNIKLLHEMPDVFRSEMGLARMKQKGLIKEIPDNLTNYLAITGPETFWSNDRGMLPNRINSMTAVVIEDSSKKIPWTKPEDLYYEEALAILTSSDPEVFSSYRSDSAFSYYYHSWKHVLLQNGYVETIPMGGNQDTWKRILSIRYPDFIYSDDLFNHRVHHTKKKHFEIYMFRLMVFIIILPLLVVFFFPKLHPNSNEN